MQSPFIKSAVLACCIGIASSGAVADDAAPAAADPETSARVSKEIDELNSAAAAAPKMVCRYESVVGSHFRRRVCRTTAEIEQLGEEARRLLEDVSFRGVEIQDGDSVGRGFDMGNSSNTSPDG